MPMPGPRTFQCRIRTERDRINKIATYICTAKDTQTGEPVYVLRASKPWEGIFSRATMQLATAPDVLIMTTEIASIVVRDPEEDGHIGRVMTHRFHDGDGQLLSVTERPDGRRWEPRRFAYRGRDYLWLHGEWKGRGLFEVDPAKLAEDAEFAAAIEIVAAARGDGARKMEVKVNAEDQVKKGTALARSNMPFWAYMLSLWDLEVKIGEEIVGDEAFVRLALGSAMLAQMVSLKGP
ncbi:uncharacterized protein BJX67DRAFT_289817 [Aspergillus lucknowensis]|uniref:Uncharacterized protein n=1 Tax=Aspergillus lucknowensis TaxID=176173 RepID=A0ABR4LHI5_9EURO